MFYLLRRDNNDNDCQDHWHRMMATTYRDALKEAEYTILNSYFGEDRDQTERKQIRWFYTETATIVEVCDEIKIDINSIIEKEWQVLENKSKVISEAEERQLLKKLQAKYGKEPDHSDSAIFCGHANEMPTVCPCDSNCYCYKHGNCGKRKRRLNGK